MVLLFVLLNVDRTMEGMLGDVGVDRYLLQEAVLVDLA